AKVVHTTDRNSGGHKVTVLSADLGGQDATRGVPRQIQRTATEFGAAKAHNSFGVHECFGQVGFGHQAVAGRDKDEATFYKWLGDEAVQSWIAFAKATTVQEHHHWPALDGLARKIDIQSLTRAD